MMDSLPNEVCAPDSAPDERWKDVCSPLGQILDAVLDSLPTPSLLPMALVCRRFCAAVKETLRVRLLQTTDLDGLEMVLECYHPIAKLSTPMLSCRQGPLTTLGPATAAAPSPWDEGWGLGDVGRLYSRFVPEDAEAKQEVTLDEDELFSQLCTSAAIVKKGPRRGFYRSHSSVGDGVMRVWRDWLAASASTPAAKAETETTKGCEEDTILWADHGKTVGVRFGVTPSDHATPSTEAGEEPAVEYTLHYRGMFLPSWEQCFGGGLS